MWVADLAKDAWFHPLAGPRRRMPTNHLQAFGAERPGERPPECVSGHCGVDVGGGLWGEPVHAAHEGVVDRVNRGPNETAEIQLKGRKELLPVSRSFVHVFRQM